MGINVVTLAAAKRYVNKVGSTIQGTSYDYDTGQIIFHTADGYCMVIRIAHNLKFNFFITLYALFNKNLMHR